jgi:hypothetical protein
MTWKRKAYMVAAALDGRVLQWWPMGRQTFASATLETEDGIFQAYYSKSLYLCISNNISDSHQGAFSVAVGKDSEGTDRFSVVYNRPKKQEVKRILTGFLRLEHPEFQLERVLGTILQRGGNSAEWAIEIQREIAAKANLDNIGNPRSIDRDWSRNA